GATRDAWRTKLRSGKFNVYVLYEYKLPETGTALKELSQAVWLGEGVIVIKPQPTAIPTLREPLGVDFGASISGSSVSLLAPLMPSTLSLTGGVTQLTLLGATSRGTVTG